MMAEEKFTHKVNPRIIHADQRKQDTRRDAWDRDYMGYYYLKEEPKSKRSSAYLMLVNRQTSDNFIPCSEREAFQIFIAASSTVLQHAVGLQRCCWFSTLSTDVCGVVCKGRRSSAAALHGQNAGASCKK